MQRSFCFEAKTSMIVKSSIKQDRAPKALLHDSLTLVKWLVYSLVLLCSHQASLTLEYFPLDGAGGQNLVDQDDLG